MVLWVVTMVPRLSLSNICCLLWAFNRQPIEYALVSLVKKKHSWFSLPGMRYSKNGVCVRIKSGNRNHTKYFNQEN